MRYRLVHLSGSLAGKIRECDEADGEVVLGRDPSVQVVFPAEDRQVSRRHAVLTVGDDALVLRDLDSSTGTFFAGEDIEEAEIGDGDVFELGRGGPRIRIEVADEATIVVPKGNEPAAGPARVEARQPLRPGSRLHLTFLSGSRTGEAVEATGSVVRLGRGSGNTLRFLEERVVSSEHAKLVRFPDAYVLMDLDSTNGTFLNGVRVERAPIQDGDRIGLGAGGPEVSVAILPPSAADHGSHATVIIPHFAELVGRRSTGVVVHEVPLDHPVLTIGRDPHAHLHLDSPIVSKFHARLVQREGTLSIEDLGSANGTYVGTARVERAALALGDRVVVGPFQIEILLGRVRLIDTRNRARLDARNLNVRAGDRLLLDDFSLSLPPASFTAIIGASGSGKTTLLNALSGVQRAAEGQVFLNGVDLYQNFEAVKATLGYVPQDDIVHRELTVWQSLNYTARLRLPPDCSAAERIQRCEAVLATLELSQRRDTTIARLSGGQRKRVSIAAELLTEPNLLFFDEPTSGLDPGLEESLMLLLRELSYKGKTIVVVTHSVDHVQLCDALLVVAEGGLAFFGRPDEARSYFQIGHLTEIYTHLKRKPSEDWRRAFHDTESYRERVLLPLSTVPGAETRQAATAAHSPVRHGALRQAWILASRYLLTLSRDRRNLGLLLLQAPLIAALVGLSLQLGTSPAAYAKPVNTILFLLALTSVWFGCSNAAREIVKERPIFRRERMVNLDVAPYVFSKAAVLVLLATIQCACSLVILGNWYHLPGSWLALWCGMVVTATVGILLGLALSALASTADRALTLLPVLLIPQVLFTFPAVQTDMGGPAGIVAKAMPTWWSFDLLRRVAVASEDGLDDDTVMKRLEANESVLLSEGRLTRMLDDGYLLFEHRNAIEITWSSKAVARLAERLPRSWNRHRPAVFDLLILLSFALALWISALFAVRRLHT